MIEQNSAQKKAELSKSKDDWKSYKKLIKQVNGRIKVEKHKWQQYELSECSSDPSSTWKKIKGWLGWTSRGPPTQLFDGTKMCNKPSDLSSTMNKYFVNKVKQIRSELPNSNEDPLKLVRRLMGDKNCKLKLEAVHPDTILKIITSLKIQILWD